MQHGTRDAPTVKKARDKVREAALEILNRRDERQVPVDTILEDVTCNRRLSKLDRAFMNGLVYGVLRWRGKLDWVIKHFSHVKIGRIDPSVLNILRMGLFQILYLSRVPDAAAVNTSVELTKAAADLRTVKYVNAVLRKASAAYEDVTFPDFKTDPVAAIAASMAFPRWIVQRWVERIGPLETRRLCEALNIIPPITVRTNRLKTDRESLVHLLEHEAADVRETPHSPDGVSFFHPKLPIANLSTYQKGWFQVQDEAAQLVTVYLDPKPNETVLDACAGLGGKTGHIAQLMSNQGRLIAMDRDQQKLSRLRSEMMHLGVSIVTTNHHDLTIPFDKTPSRSFDRILLDAPCSGLGVLRRNPDAKWVPAKSHLDAFRQRQITFMRTLASQVKTGGILQYVVCSMEPEETEAVACAFIESHPNFSVDKPDGSLSPTLSPFIDGNGFFRTYPHTDNMDGFFSVRFKRMK